MSSRNSSVGSGYGSSDFVYQETFRSHKSKNHQGERIERESHGKHSVIYNHNARGFEQGAPTPNYSRASSHRKQESS